jgi:hypothetical protein
MKDRSKLNPSVDTATMRATVPAIENLNFQLK